MNSSLNFPTLVGHGRAVLAGAGGGLLSFVAGEVFHALFGSEAYGGSYLDVLRSAALWSGVIGLPLGVTILIHDNFQSLRGQWYRDVLPAMPLFFGLGFCGGVAGQLAYSLGQNSLTRGIGWAIIGAGVGVGIGLLRRDHAQSKRGALGGALGGFAGGWLFNGLALLSDAGGGAFSRFVGQIIMGALIALLMRVVQEALKDAYLLGVSAGPYEGKEYPLNTARVSVGRAQGNDISLFREEIVPAQLGALVFGGGGWSWQGQAVDINGALQSQAPLAPGDTLQLGATRFRFYWRGAKTSAAAPDTSLSGFNASSNASVSNGAMISNLSNASTVGSNAPIGPINAAPPVPAAPPTPPRQALWPRSNPAKVAASGLSPVFVLRAADDETLSIRDGAEAVSVGRAAQNDLILADSGVSSSHATLQNQGGQLWVCDLNSTNGTFVNDGKIPPQTPQLLRLGDRVRFGKVETVVGVG